MCDPTGGLLTSAVVAGLGTAATMYGQQKQQEAYNKVQNAQADAQRRANEQALALQQAEAARQRGYQQQSEALLNESVKRNSLDSQTAQEAAIREALANQYNGDIPAATDVSAIPGLQREPSGNDGTPRVVADAYQRAFGKAGDYLSGLANSKAALDAFSNLNVANSQYNARQLEGQSLLGREMIGSGSILGNELAASKNTLDLGLANAALAGNGSAQQAALWGGIGQLGMNVGLQGVTGLGSQYLAARSAAPYAAGISYDKTLGYVPKAAPANIR